MCSNVLLLWVKKLDLQMSNFNYWKLFPPPTPFNVIHNSFSRGSCQIQTKKMILERVSNQEAHFVLQISQPAKVAQNWFWIQNLCLDLNFQKKKTIWKSDIWLLRYKENKTAHFHFIHPVLGKILVLKWVKLFVK